MSSTERQKLTFDLSRLAAAQLRLAISCRTAATLHPTYRPHLRAKMRHHALAARGKTAATATAAPL
jgi:hypothetical protein